MSNDDVTAVIPTEPPMARVLTAEFFGTLLLMIIGPGSAILASDRIGTMGVALAFGFALLAGAYAFGSVSGCHINPAVTLGLALGGKLAWARVLPYWAAQFLGAVAGIDVALPDPAVASAFLDAFGRPLRTSSCECERAGGADLGSVLKLVNSEAVHAKVTAAGGRVAKLLAAKKTNDEIVEELYLATLSRPPDTGERAAVRRLLADAPSRKEGFEDLLWALVNLAEFGWNH